MASAQEIARITRIVRGMDNDQRANLRDHLQTGAPLTVSIPLGMKALSKVAPKYHPIFQKALDARSQRSAAGPADVHHAHA